MFELLDGGSTSETGVTVSADSAISDTAVWAAVRIISDAVAMLPLQLLEREEKDGRLFRSKARKHPLYPILHERPCPELTSFEWREMMQANLLVRGNAYCERQLDRSGRLVALWPLRSDSMEVERKDGRLLYRYRLRDGGRIFEKEQILHLRGFATEGLVGLNVASKMRDAIGMSLALRKYASKFFVNGARIAGILIAPQGVKLGEQGRKNLRASIEETYGGLDNALRIMILEEQFDFKQIGVSPADAQALESRKFSAIEVCRIFNIPPHMMKELERATFASVEQLSIDFVRHCLDPWLVRWEQRLKHDLIKEDERDGLDVHFERGGLLRGTAVERATFYQLMRLAGVMSANDIRELEDLNPIEGEGGDVYLIPLNMIAVGGGGGGNGGGRTNKDEQGQQGQQGQERQDGQDGREERGNARANRAGAEATRARLRARYEPLFREAAERVVKGEVRELKKALNGAFATRARERRGVAQFVKFLEDYYGYGPGKEIPWGAAELYFKHMAGTEAAFGQAMGELAAKEIGLETLGMDISEFLRKATIEQGRYWEAVSSTQLQTILGRTEIDEAAMEREINRILDEWIEERAGKVAGSRVVTADGAVSRHVWQQAGVRKIKWVAQAGACPLCEKLNGKVVGIEGPFLKDGEEVAGEGVAPLKARGPMMHPPLHTGCVCSVVVG